MNWKAIKWLSFLALGVTGFSLMLYRGTYLNTWKGVDYYQIFDISFWNFGIIIIILILIMFYKLFKDDDEEDMEE